jgi:VWFA-related protein
VKRLASAVSVAIILCSLVGAQEAPPEEVAVRLVLVETLVMDGDRRTVPDLPKEDFELKVNGESVQIDTFDVYCPIGAADDPQPVVKGALPVALAPEMKRRMVLVLDYPHLTTRDVSRVLKEAARMVQDSKGPDDEIMVVALADLLRIEQGFTSDTQEVLDTLKRMYYDASLWAPDLSRQTAKTYFRNLGTLMDVLESYDGPKAAILYSSLLSRADFDETYFLDMAQRAALSRTAVYPAYAIGFKSPTPTAGSRAMVRMAQETGGRTPGKTRDLSIGFRRAQRDMACRYTLGYEIDPESGAAPMEIYVRLKRPGFELRHPESVRLWSEEEIRLSRTRAALVDPEQFADPFVRAFAYPVRPKSDKLWDTVVAMHLPVRVGSDGAALDLTATLAQGTEQLVSYDEQIRIPATEDGTRVLPVTVFGNPELPPGAYELTIAVSQPGDAQVASTRLDFNVPEMPKNELILRGPVLARVVQDGLLIRTNAEEQEATPREQEVRELLGDNDTFEPLVVHDVAVTDTLLTLWEACIVGKGAAPTGTVERRVLSREGEVVHLLDPVHLTLDGEGPVRCHGRLDEVAPGTLAPGEYVLEVSIAEMRESVPFQVH